MKELSIEQKAKRYDEAVKYGQNLINERCKEGTDGSFHRADLQKMFPELKESEDEKMMNQLHSWMKEFGGAEEYTEKVYQWIKGLLEKQGEQKPVIEMKSAEESLDISSDTYNKIVDECIYSEQKSADKVEPFDKFEGLTDSLSGFIGNEDKIDWLKFLKDRVQPQPKQEWDEEDESMRTMCIGILCKCFMGELPTKVEEELNWLKSLKDRCTWKPSTAQLNALSIVSKGNAPDDIEAIVSLYNDLKKLMEE